MVRLIEVRQPREHDVVAARFALAGFGSGFEATVTWRLLGAGGAPLGEGPVPGVGSMGVVDDFALEVALPAGVDARGEHALLQVFGDDASGENPPGTDLNQVRVTLFTGMHGWRLHEVVPGDTLSRIARDQGQGTTVGDVFEANRDSLMDPDLIFPGQVLRVPLF